MVVVLLAKRRRNSAVTERLRDALSVEIQLIVAQLYEENKYKNNRLSITATDQELHIS